jgi:hypothetical protein
MSTVAESFVPLVRLKIDGTSTDLVIVNHATRAYSNVGVVVIMKEKHLAVCDSTGRETTATSFVKAVAEVGHDLSPLTAKNEGLKDNSENTSLCNVS